MTNHWVDIKNANLVVVMGGNAAEAHPVGFRWAMEAKIHNGAKLIVIDPRFTRTAAVADYYAPIRSGTDIAFLSGVLLYLLNNEKFNREYTEAYTNASLIVREDYGFEDGLFTGYDAEKRKYDKSSWTYELDENGFAKRDTTLQHPRCVWNLLKQHVSRYTPDVVENICGTPKDAFLKVCEYIAETSAHDKTASFLYALGWTQHSVGAQNIRTMAMIQLLLGNMGMAGGGVNALRGHSNIQGLTDLGLPPQPASRVRTSAADTSSAVTFFASMMVSSFDWSIRESVPFRTSQRGQFIPLNGLISGSFSGIILHDRCPNIPSGKVHFSGRFLFGRKKSPRARGKPGVGDEK